MKRLIMILGMAMCVTLGHAQNSNRAQTAFDEWRREIHEDFDDFRKSIMQEYVEFLSNPWKEFKEEKPVPKPKDDTVPPLVIPKSDPITILKPNPIVIDEIIKPLPVVPQPKPVVPIEEAPVDRNRYKEFSFFGTDAKVRVAEEGFALNGVSERDVANAISTLADDRFNNTIVDCLELRKSLHLCDWAYLMMIKEMSEALYGKGSNESVVFMSYVYMSSGYRMRFASSGNRLYMLYASDHHIYDQGYYMLDGDCYYGLEDLPSSLHISGTAFKGEKSMSLLIAEAPKFAVASSSPSTHQSKRNSNMKVTMTANKNMLDFYSSYPTSTLGDNFVSRWAMYANMPMPENARSQVYPQLREAISGADQLTAVNRILNWVQTGFEYEYGNKVWGGDRAFFPEESLHYPYCDCEDRSILLTRIVRDLLGLKCILIYYPGHLAAAVAITEGNPTGDYIEYKGSRFFITDGTITGYGAPVGATMSGMDNKAAKVILLE